MSRYTPIDGQDLAQPLPYDPETDIAVQVEASVQMSLKQLCTTYIDSVLLHSPLRTLSQTLSAWRVLIMLRASGVVRAIGISNAYDIAVLEALERDGGARPDIVQNRWYEGNKWDKDVWAYCVERGIQYQ